MRTKFAAVLAALIVASLALPASAVPKPGDPDFEPTLRTERVYFRCASDVKVQNVDQISGVIPTWDTNAPAGAVTDGEGCGTYDNLLSGNDSFTAVWRGTFAGNIDNMNVELHRLVAGAGGSVTAPQLVVALLINGNEVYNGDVSGFEWTASSTGASESTELNFNDIDLLTEHGDGETVRTFELRIDSYNEAQTAWVWDSTDVPAGITFNPEKNAFPRVKV